MREENNRDVRADEGGARASEMWGVYACVPWRASRVIWTVPAVGCQNQRESEKERERNQEMMEDTSKAKIRACMNPMIYKWTELALI